MMDEKHVTCPDTEKWGQTPPPPPMTPVLAPMPNMQLARIKADLFIYSTAGNILTCQHNVSLLIATVKAGHRRLHITRQHTSN